MTLPRRHPCVLVLAFASLIVAGCGRTEPIASYSVPRLPEAKRQQYRILGALYPREAPVWYFKFTGTAEEIAKHEKDFDQLMISVRPSTGNKPPEFKLPPGWINIGERTSTRMGITNKTDAVLKIGSKDAALEVTINFNNGDLRQNLIRWADQVAADYEPDSIVESASVFPAIGMNGLRVDFVGPKNPSAGGGPMMKSR